MVVLHRTLTSLGATNLAENFAAGAKSGLVNLAITLDDLDDDTVLVGELGDVLIALVPSHDGAAIVECLDERHGGGGSHREPFVFGEFIAALLVNRLSKLARIIDEAD